MTWGRTYLWIAILIFAAAASVVARLVEIGEANLIDGRNPISFCNLLFAGNLVAALTLFASITGNGAPPTCAPYRVGNG